MINTLATLYVAFVALAVTEEYRGPNDLIVSLVFIASAVPAIARLWPRFKRFWDTGNLT
jgi:hypothetical protein